MVVADAEETAKAEDGVRNAPARLLDHDALNPSPIFSSPHHSNSRPFNLIAADQRAVLLR